MTTEPILLTVTKVIVTFTKVALDNMKIQHKNPLIDEILLNILHILVLYI